jgi:DNA-binding transcriptional MerR regulator
MPTDEAHYSIGDLAGLAGATARTIRYYVAQGLLPPPVGVGPGAHYTDDHLGRLRLIRRLQRQHQPLSEIRQRLASLGQGEVAALVAADQAEAGAPPPDSALEYLRSILASPTTASPSQPIAPTPLAAAQAPSAPSIPAPGPVPATPVALGSPRFALRRAMPAMRDVPALRVAEDAAPWPAPSDSGTPAEPAEPPTAPIEQRSQWDRIGLTPNIEIHVRRPLSRLENRRVERLITIARQLLREEQP